MLTQHPHEQPLYFGDHLGEFTDELDAGDHIVDLATISRPLVKQYQLVYSKRALDSRTYLTYPFDYESDSDEDQ